MGISIIKREDFEGSDKDYQDYLDTIKEVEMETEKYDYDISKKKTKKSKKSKKVATAKHGGLAKRGYGVARRG